MQLTIGQRFREGGGEGGLLAAFPLNPLPEDQLQFFFPKRTRYLPSKEQLFVSFLLQKSTVAIMSHYQKPKYYYVYYGVLLHKSSGPIMCYYEKPNSQLLAISRTLGEVGSFFTVFLVLNLNFREKGVDSFNFRGSRFLQWVINVIQLDGKRDPFQVHFSSKWKLWF